MVWLAPRRKRRLSKADMAQHAVVAVCMEDE